MPAHPSRTSQGQWPHAPAATAPSFTPEDVTAFRLRPLGHIGTVSSSPILSSTTPLPAKHALTSRTPTTILSTVAAVAAAAGPSSTGHPQPLPLPTRSNTSNKATNASSKQHSPATRGGKEGDEASLKHAASYPAPQRRKGEDSAGEEKSGGGSAVSGLHVPSAAVPQVYAALDLFSSKATVAVSHTPVAHANSTLGTALPHNADFQDYTEASAANTQYNAKSNVDAASSGSAYLNTTSNYNTAYVPVPTSEDIAAPNLIPAEVQELAQWTRNGPAIRGTTTTTKHNKPTTTNSVANSTVLPMETEVLHHRWRERLGLRFQHRAAAALFRELAPALESASRSILTAEEAYWQQQRAEAYERGIMSSAPSNTDVPAGKMEPLMRAVQLTLHQTAVSFVEAELSLNKRSLSRLATPPLLEEGQKQTTNKPARRTGERTTVTKGADQTPLEEQENENGDNVALSHAARTAVLQTALAAERELVCKTKTATSVFDTPSVITLPPGSPVPPPVLRMETAVGATLLARILEQAEPNTPGMVFAGHLLHYYILPHVYLNYAAWLAVRPKMGGLSEQVTHLATLPLRVNQQLNVAAAASQAQGDIHYLEAVVKAWTMKSWLRCVTQERQRVAQCAAFEHAFHRLQRRLRLQRDFAAWQRRTQARQQWRQEARMAANFQQFLSASQATSGLDRVVSKGRNPRDMQPATLHTWAPTPALSAAPPLSSSTAITTAPHGPSRLNFANSTHSIPFTSSLTNHCHSSLGPKKRGAGHSRVYVSFMRQKEVSASSGDNLDSLTTGSPHDARTTAEDANEEGAVELFVVRHSDSDVDEDYDNYSGDPENFRDKKEQGFGGGSPAPRAHHSHGGSSLMYLEAPAPSGEVASPTFTDADESPTTLPDNNGHHNNSDDTVNALPALFTAMMAKLREMEEVNAYLRRELAVQSRRLRKVEADNNGLRQRNTELEEGTLLLVREKLAACNEAQQHAVTITEKTRQIRQLRSRLRAHRHRPWQRAVMRLVGDVCAVSTAAAERADEVRIRHDRFGTTDPDKETRYKNDGGVGGQMATLWNKAGAAAPTAAPTLSQNTLNEPVTISEVKERPHLDQQTATPSMKGGGGPSLSADVPRDEERLFGRVAPIVLHSTKQLPEARLILADWANSCLDDLQELEDLNGGPFAARFGSFSEEARSGLLISRLLYYLALPRYRAQTSAAEASVNVPKSSTISDEDEESQIGNGKWTGMNPRRQLLEQHGIQLDPPFPIFEDCFNDILNLSPVDCMLQLLAFATELMTSQAGDPANLSRDPQLFDDMPVGTSTTAASAATAAVTGTATTGTSAAVTKSGTTSGAAATAEMGASPDGKRTGNPAASTTAQSVVLPACPIPLHTVVDPYALARGESSAVVTLIALLYVRFAHPFHHKSRLCASQERRMLLQLWSNGDATAEELAGPLGHGSRSRRSRPSENSLNSFSSVSDEVTSPAQAAVSKEVGKVNAGSSSLKLPSPLKKSEGKSTETFSIEAEMLRKLAPEDKTPWQLFRERCLPVFGTQAHPFLLRGGFWPSEAFDTPELTAMLGALAMALHRSLELHRWHVTLSCLVPVRTYSGLSRGVFTGPSASPAALELGLRQESQEWLRLDFPLVRCCVENRQNAFRKAADTAAATANGSSAGSPLRQLAPREIPSSPTSFKFVLAQDEIRALLKSVTSVWQEDLLSLFTQRASLSPQLALPVLDLGSWRLLCSDLGLIDMTTLDDDDDDDERAIPDGGTDQRQDQKQLPHPFLVSAPSRMQQRVLDIEVVTAIFQRAIMTVAQDRDEVDPAVFNTSVNRRLQQQQNAPRENVSTEFELGVTELVPELPAANSKLVKASRSKSLRANSEHDTKERVVVPDIQMDMTYAAFILALALLANELFPGAYTPRVVTVPLSPLSTALHQRSNSNGKTSLKEEDTGTAPDITRGPPTSLAPQYCSLPMAFAEMMRCVVLTSPFVHLHPNDPRSILRRLTSGLPTQMVLHRYAPALLLVYQAYSKDIFGEEGLLREDVLRLLRDAMLTSAELSQYLVFDLFASCAVLRQASEEAAMGERRDVDGRLRPHSSSIAVAAARKPGYKAVRIVDPGASFDNTASAAAQSRRTYVLTFEGFCDLVCALCSFKQPNVFVPFEERLTLFLRRSLLRPLTYTVPGLGALVAQLQSPQEAPSKETVPDPDAPAVSQKVGLAR